MKRFIIIYIFYLIGIWGCTLDSEKKSINKTLSHNDSISIESEIIDIKSIIYVILPIDNYNSWFFPKGSRTIDINSKEVSICEVILLRHIKEYNRNHPNKQIDLSNYGRQYIAALTPQNDEVVCINAFCNPEEFDYWKNRLVLVHDGGNCFFQLLINLHTNEVIEFYVNGVA